MTSALATKEARAETRLSQEQLYTFWKPFQDRAQPCMRMREAPHVFWFCHLWPDTFRTGREPEFATVFSVTVTP